MAEAPRPPRRFTSLASVQGAIGTSLGVTSWTEVTQEAIDGFATVTRDHQWIHVDVERASASPFGGTIAHGFWTLSMLPGFARELYALDFGRARLNYGVDNVRFPAPVRVGSQIRARASIATVEARTSGDRIVVRWMVETASPEKVDVLPRLACIAETITLVMR